MARSFKFMNGFAELPVVNPESIADVLRRIASLIPYDASHARAYSPGVYQSLSDQVLRNRAKSIQRPSIGRPASSGRSCSRRRRRGERSQNAKRPTSRSRPGAAQRRAFFVYTRCVPPQPLQLAATFAAAEARPASLELITLDDRLCTAAQEEGFAFFVGKTVEELIRP